jgi:hypothetical protein
LAFLQQKETPGVCSPSRSVVSIISIFFSISKFDANTILSLRITNRAIIFYKIIKAVTSAYPQRMAVTA